jgi:predicted O-methyltransferase YrrM
MSGVRHLAGSLYRGLAAPFGARALDRMLRDGLPERLASPLRFLFGAGIPRDVVAVAARIERRRAEIARGNEEFQFTYSPSPVGVARWAELAASTSPEPSIPLRRFANSSSVPKRWGILLHLFATHLEARVILELGSCVGISSAYLASAASHPRLITIDGSPAMVAIAEETVAPFSDRALVMHSSFDSGLPRALAQFGDEGLPIDLAFIDGHHHEAPTLHYVRTILPHLSKGALIVLDDIYLRAGMRRAWAELSAMRGVSVAVNTGRFGLLVWEGGTAIPRQYDLARYTGVWRSEKASPHAQTLRS